MKAPMSSAAFELLALARRGLSEASLAERADERYVAAHLSALRSAAAVLAARARPTLPRAGRRRISNVWEVLPTVAPELTEWAAFFAASATKRAAAEAGLTRVISEREADDLLRDAATFHALVETTLGLSHQPALAV